MGWRREGATVDGAGNAADHQRPVEASNGYAAERSPALPAMAVLRAPARVVSPTPPASVGLGLHQAQELSQPSRTARSGGSQARPPVPRGVCDACAPRGMPRWITHSTIGKTSAANMRAIGMEGVYQLR